MRTCAGSAHLRYSAITSAGLRAPNFTQSMRDTSTSANESWSRTARMIGLRHRQVRDVEGGQPDAERARRADDLPELFIPASDRKWIFQGNGPPDSLSIAGDGASPEGRDILVPPLPRAFRVRPRQDPAHRRLHGIRQDGQVRGRFQQQSRQHRRAQ